MRAINLCKVAGKSDRNGSEQERKAREREREEEELKRSQLIAHVVTT